jgi:hypothetical protein
MDVTYTMPVGVETNRDYAANQGIFLSLNCGSCFAVWTGRMKAADQRKLFGRFLGKGTVVIDGNNENTFHIRTVCFGTDFDVNARVAWRDLHSTERPITSAVHVDCRS